MHYHRWFRNGGALALRRNTKPRMDRGYMMMGHKPVHVAIAEKALGKPLPHGARVHHADENKANNKNSNLVICPNHTYHMLIHQRLRAYRATGNPNLRKCVLCQKWDDPSNLYFPPSQYVGKHRACDSKYVCARQRGNGPAILAELRK